MIVQLDFYIPKGRGIAEIGQRYAKNDYPPPPTILRTVQMLNECRSYLGYASSLYSYNVLAGLDYYETTVRGCVFYLFH